MDLKSLVRVADSKASARRKLKFFSYKKGENNPWAVDTALENGGVAYTWDEYQERVNPVEKDLLNFIKSLPEAKGLNLYLDNDSDYRHGWTEEQSWVAVKWTDNDDPFKTGWEKVDKEKRDAIFKKWQKKAPEFKKKLESIFNSEDDYIEMWDEDQCPGFTVGILEYSEHDD